MPSGFSIIITGKTLDPDAFMLMSPKRELPWSIVPKTSNCTPAIELYDVTAGHYSLDLIYEVLDFLRDYKNEIRQALNFIGVESRTLNLYDETHYDILEFSLKNEDLRLLTEWGLDVTFGSISCEWEVGNRLLRR